MRKNSGNYDGIDWSLDEKTGILTLGKEGETQVLAFAVEGSDDVEDIELFGIPEEFVEEDIERWPDSWPWDAERDKIKAVETKGHLVMQGTLDNMFGNCKNLEKIDLSEWDMENVVDTSEMFKNCGNLTSLDVSEWDTSSLEVASEMFQGCSKLEDLDVSKWDTLRMTDMSNMFKNCSNMQSLDLSGWNVRNVKSTKSMFENCKSLRSLDVSGFDMSNVTNMDYMFNNCNQLLSVKIPGWNKSQVDRLQDALSRCDGVTIEKNKNYDGIDWSLDEKTGILTLGKEGETQILANNSVRDHKSWPWDAHRSSIKAVKTEGDLVLRGSLKGMFADCYALTSLDLSGWDTLNVDNMSGMFSGCHHLKELNISDFDTSNVKDMSRMFGYCGLQSLDVSGFDTSNVANMSYMFFTCDNLRSLDLSGFDTSNVTTMATMFRGCHDMESVDVSNFNTSNVVDMRDMFFGCNSLKSLDLSGFDTSKVTHMDDNMFFNCNSLSSLNISGWGELRKSFVNEVRETCPGITIIEDVPQKDSIIPKQNYEGIENTLQKDSAVTRRSRAQMAEELFGHIQSNDLYGGLEK